MHLVSRCIIISYSTICIFHIPSIIIITVDVQCNVTSSGRPRETLMKKI